MLSNLFKYGFAIVLALTAPKIMISNYPLHKVEKT